MKRLFALIMTLLLVFGCEGLQPAQEAVITLDSEQKTEISLSSDGGAFDVSFTSALDWTAEIVYMSGGEGWASMNPTSGKGGYSIARLKINVQKNSGSDPRSAKVVITSGTKTAVITFKQEEHKGLLPGPDQDFVFRLTEKRAEVPAEGGTVKVTVEYNVDYKCEVTADWIREIESKSYDQKVHVFEVLPNDSEEPRNTTISFCGNGTCIPFKVEQAGGVTEYRLEVDAKTISVEAAGTASPIKVNVTSNVQWNVASDAEWCTVDPSSGVNDGSFNVSISENTSYEPRMAKVNVSSSDGHICREIAVIQAPEASVADDSWQNEEFIHKSLALRFTADWCGYCPQMATALKNAQKELPDRVEAISVHGGGSGLASEASNALTNHYGINSFPTGLVDGWIWLQNYDIATTTQNFVNAVKNTESNYDVVTGSSWKSTVSGNQIMLNLSLYIKETGSYKVTALAVEDGVVSYQADYNAGSSDSYVHDAIIRESFTDVTGDLFTVSAGAEQKDFSYSVNLPSGCNVENMRVVVYVQKKVSDSFVVDNAASAKVGVVKHLSVKSGNWGSGNEGVVPGDDINL